MMPRPLGAERPVCPLCYSGLARLEGLNIWTYVARGFDGTASSWRDIMEADASVPGLPNKADISRRKEQENKISLTERVEDLWLALDYIAVALRDQIKENEALKSRVAALEAGNP